MLFCQAFIPVDADTNEFIEDVDFSLFKKGVTMYSGITSANGVTEINTGIDFDSISFTRVDYNTLGISRQHLDSVVFLSKKTIYLDEVVVSYKKDKQLVLGESNRFIKKQSRTMAKDLLYGMVLNNDFDKKLSVEKIIFYVEEVKLKTAYKLNFYYIEESIPNRGTQIANIGEKMFSTDVLYLMPNQKGKIEIDTRSYGLEFPKGSLFLSCQLIDYYDQDMKIIAPSIDQQTRLKFQISYKTNFYSRGINYISKELTPELLNINFMINYDFANQFYKKPPKSIRATPAIILCESEIEE
ncbi:hypothetical protein HYN48_14280 [Flavobacterium magnum]|uniref:Uncharacterized protein n=1 Tax=Flavobacterium magnum TaxID=2162713 RepID=A0A2S0RHM8_9FLAO|nr:hypothetical protein HYN48_14280 [Flavobacterium magnum]